MKTKIQSSSFGRFGKIYWVGALAAFLLTIGAAKATIYSFAEGGTFGSLDQNNPLVTPANVQSQACVPTSVANGLVWLDNTYNVPNLVQSSPEESAYPTVNTLITDMGTTTGGTSFSGEVNGLSMYIGATGQNVSPPVTIAGGQVSGGLGGFNQIQNAVPSALYLYNALAANEAVEFWINWYNPVSQTYKGAHSLTLTGISYNNVSQAGTLSFIDPFGTGAGAVTINSATFTTIAGGYLFINGGYTGGAANNGADPDNTLLSSTGAIITDLVEAVPEPTTFELMVATVLLGLAMRRLRFQA
jgi:hypothetical protein